MERNDAQVARMASTGAIRDALSAGQTPKPSPSDTATPMARNGTFLIAFTPYLNRSSRTERPIS